MTTTTPEVGTHTDAHPDAEHDGEELRGTLRITRRAPRLLRRLRNGSPFASAARYNFPSDYAEQLRTVIAPYAVRLEVHIDEPRLLDAELVSANRDQILAALNAVVAHENSPSPRR